MDVSALLTDTGSTSMVVIKENDSVGSVKRSLATAFGLRAADRFELALNDPEHILDEDETAPASTTGVTSLDTLVMTLLAPSVHAPYQYAISSTPLGVTLSSTKKFLYAHDNSHVHLYNTLTGVLVHSHTRRVPRRKVLFVCLNDARKVVVVVTTVSIEVLRSDTFEVLCVRRHTAESGEELGAPTAATSRDDVVFLAYHRICVFSCATQRIVQTDAQARRATSLLLSQSGACLYSGTSKGGIVAFNTRTWVPFARSTVRDLQANKMVECRGTVISISTESGLVSVWEPTTLHLIHRFACDHEDLHGGGASPPDRFLSSLALSDDKRSLYIGGWGISVWDAVALTPKGMLTKESHCGDVVVQEEWVFHATGCGMYVCDRESIEREPVKTQPVAPAPKKTKKWWKACVSI